MTDKLSRRDFLKLSGLGLGAIGLNHIKKEGGSVLKIASPDNKQVHGLGLADDPQLFYGKEGADYAETLTHDLVRMHSEIHDVFKTQLSGLEEMDTGGVSVSYKFFVDQIKERALQVKYAEDNNLNNILPILYDRYYEAASFADSIADLYRDMQINGKDLFGKSILVALSSVDIDHIGSDTLSDMLANRAENISVWNYQWDKVGSGKDINPLLLLIFLDKSAMPVTYSWKEYGADYTFDLPKDAKIPFDQPDRGPEQPSRVKKVLVDDDVANELSNIFDKLGLDRSANNIVYIPNLKPKDKGVLADASPDGIVHLYFPEGKVLDYQTYLKFRREILHTDFHELSHELKFRFPFLSRSDQLKVRDLELNILNICSPFTSIQNTLCPNGWPDGDYGEIQTSVYAFSRYFLESVVNVYQDQRPGALDFLFEFNYITNQLMGENVYRDLSMPFFFTNPEAHINNINSNLDKFNGITKLFANKIVRSKDDIMVSKIWVQSMSDMPYYFNTVILPLIFTQTVMHNPEELFKTINSNKLGSRMELALNYLKTFRKRYVEYVNGGPSNEFLAELFGEAMITKLGDYGPHPVQMINDIVPLFDQIINIYKSANLADISTPSTTA